MDLEVCPKIARLYLDDVLRRLWWFRYVSVIYWVTIPGPCTNNKRREGGVFTFIRK